MDTGAMTKEIEPDTTRVVASGIGSTVAVSLDFTARLTTGSGDDEKGPPCK